MSEIILNEREWVKQTLREPAIELLTGETVFRIAKVLNCEKLKTREIEKRINEFVLRCNPKENIAGWTEFIEKCIASSKGRKILELDRVKVTHKEIEAVRRVESIQGRRLLFTLICLCRVQNYGRENPTDWVNIESNKLFTRANITLGRERGQALIRSLWQSGYIGYSKIIDNLNLKINVMAEEDESELEVSSFKNLGNQYMMYEGEPFIACQLCGLVVRQGSRAQKYCKSCADEIRRMRKNEKRERAFTAN